VKTDSGMPNAMFGYVGVDDYRGKNSRDEKISCAVFLNLRGETIEDYVAVAQRLCNQRTR